MNIKKLFIKVIFSFIYFSLFTIKVLNAEDLCYVNRWAFESICHHIYDPSIPGQWNYSTSVTVKKPVDFDPKLVQPGDIVFTRKVNTFFHGVFNLIKHPIILVTSGDYRETLNESQLKQFIDNDKIIAWFAVHTKTSAHPKLFSIPLGIDQRDPKLFINWKSFNNTLKSLHENAKNRLLYLNYNDVGMKVRVQLKEIWRHQPDCFYSAPNKKHLDYFREMSTCKFTLCPPGWGPDSYRVWEALLVGSIPIVEKVSQSMTKLYFELPILIVDDLKKIDTEFLKREYEKISKCKYNMQKLYMRYWIDKIYSMRRNYLASIGQNPNQY
jgi:hypothetical protein